MKRIIMVSFIMLAAAILMSQPIIEFEKLEHNFGRIKEEAGPHEVEFTFTNTGDEPFRLINVKAG